MQKCFFFFFIVGYARVILYDFHALVSMTIVRCVYYLINIKDYYLPRDYIKNYDIRLLIDLVLSEQTKRDRGPLMLIVLLMIICQRGHR